MKNASTLLVKFCPQKHSTQMDDHRPRPAVVYYGGTFNLDSFLKLPAQTSLMRPAVPNPRRTQPRLRTTLRL